MSDKSPHLDEVKKLWRKDSATLGFFPDGAFAEYADKGQVIAAQRDGTVLGYTLFRRTGNRVAIVHLCVDGAARGQGVARHLVDAVSRAAPDADGVSLRCRRDFEADRVWPKLGFRPLRHLRGRGKDGALLTLWYKSHGNDDLFTLAEKKGEPRTIAVVDANVFFDLAEGEERTANESKALLADWLRDIVELKVTNELFTEILRSDNNDLRQRNLEFAQQFKVVAVDTDEVAQARRTVDEVLPPAKNDRDKSDRAHLAACVAAKVGHFITRDGLLRDYGSELFERTQVSVLRPSEFIADLDELERADAYRPARFAGTSMRLVPGKELAEDRLAETFRGQDRRSEFLSALRSRIAMPRSHDTQVVVADGQPVALISYEQAADARLRVGLMRTAGTGARTLASYLTHHVRVAAVKRKATFIVVDDWGADAQVREALEQDEFQRIGACWIQAVCDVVGSRRDLREWLSIRRAKATSPEVAGMLDVLDAEALLSDSAPASLVERRLWPAKVLDDTVPTYVIPVRAYWAQQLFDAELSDLELFGADPRLVMSRENVYYRSPSNPRRLPVPARVLWYVSSDARKPGTGAIRACSRLVEVTVGTPKNVYKLGRRLGIYEWKDVLETANGSRDGMVQLLRFCDTETFSSPVALREVRSILEALAVRGVNTSFPGPQRISDEPFSAIYRAGTGR